MKSTVCTFISLHAYRIFTCILCLLLLLYRTSAVVFFDTEEGMNNAWYEVCGGMEDDELPLQQMEELKLTVNTVAGGFYNNNVNTTAKGAIFVYKLTVSTEAGGFYSNNNVNTVAEGAILV